ncbi:hypothetical protein SCA05_20190 [Staphylococcus carnosus]|nr:hypothetical protein SE1039_26300 [Staphylococcus equorum]GEP80226.1 hypothetical protein SCA05_20190 [Staphylococcus carnosus]
MFDDSVNFSNLVDRSKLNEESKDIADMNDSEENKNTFLNTYYM